MSVTSYLKTDLSPYKLNEDAQRLIKRLRKKFCTSIEEKILVLLNAASLHPSMSTYQLSLSRQALGDCYYDLAFYGSALAQYQSGIELNPRLAVKRRIKELCAIPRDGQKTSASPDIVEDVLTFPEYAKYAPCNSALAAPFSSQSLYDAALAAGILEAQQEDQIYDPEFEADIKQRLSVLGEPYISEFYRLRDVERLTNKADVLSMKRLDLLRLKAMEKSAHRGT